MRVAVIGGLLLAAACGEGEARVDAGPEVPPLTLRVDDVASLPTVNGASPSRDLFLAVEVTVEAAMDASAVVALSPERFSLVLVDRSARLPSEPGGDDACAADSAVLAGGRGSCLLYFDLTTDARFVAVSFRGPDDVPLESATPVMSPPPFADEQRPLADLNPLELQRFCDGLAPIGEEEVVCGGDVVQTLGPALLEDACELGHLPAVVTDTGGTCTDFDAAMCSGPAYETCAAALDGDPCAVRGEACDCATPGTEGPLCVLLRDI